MTLAFSSLACAAILVCAPAAQAATYLIDGFDSPTPVITSVLASVGERSFMQFSADLAGGVRDVYHHPYINPLSSVSALAVGNGILSSSDGVGAISEVQVAYGAFTRPTDDPNVPGPLLGLDTRPFGGFVVEFAAVSKPLNLIVTMYSSTPLDASSVLPTYYVNSGMSLDPTLPGGPLTVLFDFGYAPGFNYASVDGFALLINRSVGNVPGNAYNLDSFGLVSSVPETSTPALLAAGLGLIWLLRRRARRAVALTRSLSAAAPAAPCRDRLSWPRTGPRRHGPARRRGRCRWGR